MTTERYGCGLLVLAMVLPLVLAGCFSRNTAEGFYVESAESGRVLWSERKVDRLHLVRLNLLHFDEEVGGIVEVFRVSRYATFAQQPRDIPQSSEHYFCTRIEQGTLKREVLTLRFTDWLNRRWQISGDLVDDGDAVAGRLERLWAGGDVVDAVAEPSECSVLLPEDAYYLGQGEPASQQIVLMRESTKVNKEQLFCADYHWRADIAVEVPAFIEGCNRYRLALVMTKGETGTSAAAPLEGLLRAEFLTATLDRYDLLGDERRVAIRRRPTLLSDPGSGFAVGTLIVYEDLPPYNDRWDNLRVGASVHERVIAYLPSSVLVFAEQLATTPRFARDADGVRLSEPLYGDLSEVPLGWQVNSVQGEAVFLRDGERVMLIHHLQAEANKVLRLVPVPEACQACYPAPAGQEEACAPCPPILPLLFL